MLKRITAFICSIVALLGIFAPSAWAEGARMGSCWDVVSQNAPLVTVQNGELVLNGADGKSATWTYDRLFSYDVTLRFSAKIDVAATMGVQLYNGATRSGFYLKESGYNIFGGGGASYAVGKEWHDYEIEVIDNVQKIYIDNQLVSVHPGQPQNTQTSVKFWTNAGGKIRFGYWELQTHDGSKPRVKTASYGGEWLPGEDYTPAFTQDWKTDTGNWNITNDPGVEWDKEAGVIRLDGSKSMNGNYLPVQHALNLTQNFDWKWRWRIIRNVKTRIQIKFYGDYLNLYFYVRDNNMLQGGQWGESIVDGSYRSKGLAIPVNMGESMGDWCDMELRRRGEYLTLYVNGGKTKTWRAYETNEKMGMIGLAVEGSGIGNMNSDCIEIGETSYTPYFPTVEMTCPLYKSEYVQGTDVQLQAKAQGETEYIDYFVDDVKVGRGYAPDYTYVLKKVQPGTYNISAGVGTERSAPTVMTVRPAISTELVLSEAEIPYGSTVEARVNAVAYSSDADVKSVEYYVDGDFAAKSESAPFNVQLNIPKVGTASVYANVRNKQDVVLTTGIKTIDVYTNGDGERKFDREYDITYKYSTGIGKIQAEDGYFKLYVENNGNVLKYLDQDGNVKEYSMTRFRDTVTGFGDWRIITTSGFAEVYYNGHMLHTFYMPRTENKNVLSFSGIEDFRMSGRGNKYTLMSDEWKNEVEYSSDVINMGIFKALGTSNVFSALEFDKTDLSDEVITFYDGKYQTQLKFKDGKVYGRDQCRLGAEIKEDFVLERPAEVGYYRVNITEGAASVWCNNNYIGSFACPLYAHKPQIIRNMTNPGASTIVAVKTVDDKYFHSEDFSGDKEMSAHDYWIPNGDISAKITQDAETGDAYTTISSATEGRFYLNGFTKDIKFKARVRVDSGKDFYVMTRMHPIYYDFKLGYDFENGCYYGEYDIFGGKAKSYGSERRTFPGTFETGVWHDVEVINDEKHLVMTVDGKTVIDTSDFWPVLSGNAGFGIVGGEMSFDDVYYEGRAKIGSGVNGVHDNEGTDYNDFVQLKDGRVASYSSNGGTRYTSDKGKTWTTPQERTNGLHNVLVTKDGNWVKISATSPKLSASISEDEGATWVKSVDIPVNHETTRLIVQNNFSNVAKNGRLLVTSDEGLTEESGKVGVWWSDDGGYTWSESETFFEETNNGINTQEASFVDMPEEGHYRIFFRTDQNFIYYADSWDDCKTFDETKLMPSPFKATCTTFKVRRDIFEEQTYYALWTYDISNSLQTSRNEPRNRVALAVSYDGMKTWEFVQSVFDSSDFPNGLVRNYSLEIMEDTIYISMNGQSGDCFLMTIDKSKIKTTKRFEEAHERTANDSTTADEEAYAICVIPNKSGQAWLLGNYEDIEVSDGRFVEAEALAKMFKSTIEKSGNTVIMKIGDGYVKFTEGSSNYEVNGEVTDFGSVCMKNGFVDIYACAKAFGKKLTENKAGNGWVIWSDDVYTDYWREQLEGLI